MISFPPFHNNNWRATQSRIWSLAWPIMLSNITVPLLGLVDTAILGHLDSASHLSAVAIGNQAFVLLFWSMGFLRMGTTALTARASGTQNHALAMRQLELALWTSLPAILFVLALAFLLWPWLLLWITPQQELQQEAQHYLSIRLWSTPATLGQYVLLGWFIGLGKTRIPLILLTSSNLVNLVCNYLLVYEFGMTSDGVALGTVIAEYSALLMALGFARELGWRGFGKRPAWPDIKPLFNINRHLFVRTLILLSTFAVFTAHGAQQSELLLATNAVFIALLLLISNALDGFAHAAEVMVGQSLGQQHEPITRLAILLTGVNSALMAILLTLIFLLSGDQLLALLTSNTELSPLLARYQYFLFFLPLAGFVSYWLDGVMLGAADSSLMRNSMAAAAFLVFHPATLLLSGWGNTGLWWALYAFLMARAIFMIPGCVKLYQKPSSFATRH